MGVHRNQDSPEVFAIQVWNIMSSRHDELTQHPQVTPSKAPPCSTTETMCDHTLLGASKHCTFCNARSCKMSLFHKDKTLWRFPGRMRCTNIVYRVHQSTRNINVMDGNTDNNRILQNFILHIKRFLALLDNSLYRACWPLLFFPPHSIFCTVYVWTSSQATVRSLRGKISPKMRFSRGCDDDAAEKGTRSMVTQIHWWRHTEPGTVWTSLS